MKARPFRLGATLLVLAASALTGACRSTPPSAAPLLERVLERRGGRERLFSLSSIAWVERGELLGVPFTERVVFRPPAEWESRIRLAGLGEEEVRRFDPTGAWIELPDGRSIALRGPEGLALRERVLDEAVFWFALIGDPNYPIEEEGGGLFEERPVFTLRVNHRTGYERRLHFDRASLDLVAMEGVGWTESGRARIVRRYSGWRFVEGIRVPGEIRTEVAGSTVRRATLTGWKFDLAGNSGSRGSPDASGRAAIAR